MKSGTDRLVRIGQAGLASAVLGGTVAAGWTSGRGNGADDPGPLLLTWLLLAVMVAPALALGARDAWARLAVIDTWSTLPLDDGRLLRRILGPELGAVVAIDALLSLFALCHGVGAGWTELEVLEAALAPIAVGGAAAVVALWLVRLGAVASGTVLVAGTFGIAGFLAAGGSAQGGTGLRWTVTAALGLVGTIGVLCFGGLPGRAALRRLRERGGSSRRAGGGRSRSRAPLRGRRNAILAAIAGDPSAPSRLRRLVWFPVIAASGAVGILALGLGHDVSASGGSTAAYLAVVAAIFVLVTTGGRLPDRRRPAPGIPLAWGSPLDPLPVTPREVLGVGMLWWGGLLAIGTALAVLPIVLWPRDASVGVAVILSLSWASGFVVLRACGELRGCSPERPAPRRLGRREKILLVGLAVAIGVVPWLVVLGLARGSVPALGGVLETVVAHPVVLGFFRGLGRWIDALSAHPRLLAAGLGLSFVSLGLPLLGRALQQREERTTDIRP